MKGGYSSFHIRRPITGRLNLSALGVLDDLMAEQTGGLGTRIGRAVVQAAAGDPIATLVAMITLPPVRTANHRPRQVDPARLPVLAGNHAARKIRRDVPLTLPRMQRCVVAL